MLTHIIRKDFNSYHIKLQIEQTCVDILFKKSGWWWITSDINGGDLIVHHFFPNLTINQSSELVMDQFNVARKNLKKQEIIIDAILKINYLQDFFINNGLIIDHLTHMKMLTLKI